MSYQYIIYNFCAEMEAIGSR